MCCVHQMTVCLNALWDNEWLIVQENFAFCGMGIRSLLINVELGHFDCGLLTIQLLPLWRAEGPFAQAVLR